MVTVVQLHPQNSVAALEPVAEGLAAPDRALLARALEFAEPLYAGQILSTGEPTWAHALGVWQRSWQLEDLSFRFLEPELYKKIARRLDEKRLARQRYIARAIEALSGELKALTLKAAISGRPKHIYSIWNKMRAKALD